MTTDLPLAGDGKVARRSCTLCEALCGLDVEVTDNRITAITGDELDPLSRGYLCPKGVANVDLVDDPDRLRRPMVRGDDGELHETDWDTALQRAADGLSRVRREYGKDALATYLGNPSYHSSSALLLLPFLEVLGTRNRYSASTTDQMPQSLAAYKMFGHQLLFPLPDLDRTDHLLVLGANPVVSNGSLVTAPDWRGRLKALKDRGGRAIVVDPRRTETARVAGEHVPIRPGTDAVLLAAMANVLFDRDLVRLGRVGGLVAGLDAVRAAVKPFTVEDAARVTGIDADTITALAVDLGEARRATVYARVGICQTRFGSVTAWLVNLLNLITGRLDEVGGAMFATPAVDLHRLVATVVGAGSHDTFRSRVRDLPEVHGELPVATLADEITTPGPGQVRALLVNAGNPVLSAPNGERLDRVLPDLEFHVAIDFYVNETNRHADVILPPTAPFEHDHYDVVFHGLAVRNTAKYSPAAVEPAPGSMHDHEIVLELARRMELGSLLRPVQMLLGLVGGQLTPMRVIAAALAVGPHGRLRRGRRGITWRQVRESEHGVDLGPLEPGRMPDVLWTDDKRIHAAPSLFVDELDRVRATLVDQADASAGDGELVLIGRRHLRSNNSWLHNSERMVKGRDRCTLLVHPDDAAARGIDDGAVVRVTSRVGEVEVAAAHDEDMTPGVVSLPHGWGHDKDGTRWRVAEANAGVSVNDLTDHELLDTLTGNAAYNELRVEVNPV